MAVFRALIRGTKVGVGVNLTCYGAVVPTPENLGRLVEIAAAAGDILDRRVAVSGGNSGSLPLALQGDLPTGVTDLRVGESILLGTNVLTREPLLGGLHLDAFALRAPVIECLRKPSLPLGELAEDAFGGRSVCEDRGVRRRVLLALGRQDVSPGLLRPRDGRMVILGASSDHLIVDVEEVDPPPRVDSSVIVMTPSLEGPYDEETRKRFFNLINGAFAQKRKTIVNSLCGSPPFPLEKKQLLAALEKCDIDPQARAQTLAPGDFHRLFAALNG